MDSVLLIMQYYWLWATAFHDGTDMVMAAIQV